MTQVLVVDDEVGIRELLSEILSDEGYDVSLAENAAAARAARNRARPDVVLLDIWMPDTDGVTLLKEWSASGQLTMPVVMMSGHGTIDTAVEATRIGAMDFLEKPIAMQKLLASVRRALAKAPSAAPQELTLAAFPRSGALRDLKRRIEQAGARSRVVMLRSAAGGIVELAARTLQPNGRGWLDVSQLALPIDVAALEAVAGGVVFAPELGQLSRLQQKSLMFAAERLERFDLRLIAATTQAHEALLAVGWEAPALARLFEIWVPLPVLVELRDDLPEIAQQVLTHLIESGQAPLRRLSSAALNSLRNYGWPGGYAELRSTLRSLAVGAPEEEIGADEVARMIGSAFQAAAALPLDVPLREAREAFERLYFEYHLQHDGISMTRLAEKSGLERTHLYRKLKALGLQVTRRGEEGTGGGVE